MGPLGFTGPSMGALQYTYNNRVTLDTSSGGFRLPLSANDTKNGVVWSTTPIVAPFSITFTLNGYRENDTANGYEHFFGITTSTSTFPNIATGAAALRSGNILTHGYSTSGGNGMNATASITSNTTNAGPVTPLTYGETSTNTYQMQFDGTNITHTLNGVRLSTGGTNTFRPTNATGPFYVVAASGYGAGMVIINYTQLLIGPLGPTGPTGQTGFTGPGALAPLSYNYNSAVVLVPSTGQYAFSNGGILVSSTPIYGGPFTLTFVFSGINQNIWQGIGLTNTSNPQNGNGPVHGIANTGIISNTSQITLADMVSGYPANRTYSIAQSVTSSYVLTFDGMHYRHYLNGNLMTKPIVNTVNGPFYVMVNMAQGGLAPNSLFTVVYSPVAIPLAGPTGSTGPPNSLLPTQRTVNTVYQVACTSNTGWTAFQGAGVRLTSSVGMVGATHTAGTMNGMTLRNDMSSKSVSPTTYLSGPVADGRFTNTSTTPINIVISILPPNPRPTNWWNLNVYLIITSSISGSTITSPIAQVSDYSYSFYLAPGGYFTIQMTATANIALANGASYFFQVIQTPVAEGGGLVGGNKIVDVIASPKPKLRKSSIRVKKAKKQTAKYKH
jgi:hypothetical protein